jgi:hypothetical protein
MPPSNIHEYLGLVRVSKPTKAISSGRHFCARFGLMAVAISIAAATCLVPFPEASASSNAASNDWTMATSPSPTGNWYDVDYADGQWIALGHTPDVAISQDGSTWTEYPVPTGSWKTVAYGNGKYVALSSVATGADEIVSTDGINWTAVPGPAGAWTGMVFAAGRFVAVGSLGQIVTSTNGQDWTQVWDHSKWDLTSVAYGNGHFVAVDSSVGSTLISSNGLDWGLYPPVGTGLKWGAVVYGNGTFVAFDESGSGDIATSVYGYHWALHRYAPSEEITGAAFGCGSFLASGQPSGATNDFLSSSTGATWSLAAVPTDTMADWTAVAYGAHRFVAVDSEGNIAWSNSASDCAASIPSAPQQLSGNVANGQVWTYMHPPAVSGGSSVNSYRVTISNGTVTKECTATVGYQPNCIVKGLNDGEVYWVTSQAHNRFGFSAFTDPEFVIPVANWTLTATTAQAVVPQAGPVTVLVTGVIANGEGIYPNTIITVHFGGVLATCHPNPFGECLVTISDPPTGLTPIFATYTGYGRTYTSPISHVTVTP